MKSNLSKFIYVVIVTMLFLAILPAYAQPSEPHTAPAMWIEPSTLSFDTDTLSVGDKFNVTVWINMDTASFVWQVKLLYDNTQLKATRTSYTHPGKSEFFDFAGSITVPVAPIIDHATGYVLHGESLMGLVQRDPGQGSLIWVEFEVIASPPPGGSLESDLDITTTYPDDTYVLDPDLATITVTPYNAHYAYAYAVPPKPHLAVDPTYTEFPQFPPSSIGKQFDIDIYIMGLSSGWSLENVSLHLGFDDVLINVMDVTFDPLWTTTTEAIVPGDLELFAGDPTTIPSGDVLVATVTFEVISQCEAPPRPAGEYDESPLDLHDYLLMGFYMEVDVDPEVDGVVRIYCLQTLELPYLEVSSVTLGPEPSVGEEFDITVSIKNLDPFWYVIGVEFRLSYDPDYLEVVGNITEGPFFPDFADQQPGSLGTFYQSFVQSNGVYGPHILVGNMIFPNGTGWWNPPWPEGEGVVTTITFRLIKHDPAPPQETVIPLNIVDQLAVGLDDPSLQNPVDVTLDTPIDGEVMLYNMLPGRMIDVYGGVDASDWGIPSPPFPAPYGGQGPNNPMDMVWPQKTVYLYTNVTYNLWPVQYKLVAFEVEGPFNAPSGREPEVLLKTTAITDEYGVALTTFRMPWQCADAESYFGVWKVTATVDVASTVINDTLTFHYDYLVRLWKVTTDKYKYCHDETVDITVEYGTHAQQSYPALFGVVIFDELNVPIGFISAETTVGGASYCQYKNDTITLRIYIPKFAFAGVASIHVNCFDKDPTDGGQAWCPEYPPPKIYIKYC